MGLDSSWKTNTMYFHAYLTLLLCSSGFLLIDVYHRTYLSDRIIVQHVIFALIIKHFNITQK